MKLHFTTLEYQTEAVSSITDLFQGEGSIAQKYMHRQGHLIGNVVANVLPVDKHNIQNNLHVIQKRNKVSCTDIDDLQFCVSMETGTGKTYVYIKTIYELHKVYGFTKFIIVVPSIAIREGVQKTFDITKEHFKHMYHTIPIHCFIYDSKKLSDIRDFAQSNTIEIMIINIDAFNKDKNIIHQEMDRMSGDRPIDLIAEINPIVIIDEPQSSVNTDKAKEALSWLNPLVVLRYSATHRDEINTVYTLSPTKAYEQGLVKSIYVSSITSEDDFNKPYIELLSVDNTNGYKAKIKLDVKTSVGKISRVERTVQNNTHLFEISKERELYHGWYITNIDCQPGYEHIELNGIHRLFVGQIMGNISEKDIKRGQIRKTIEHHLNKELLLLQQGIKVLSLFFIDKVENYRLYGKEDTNEYSKGEYARIFEEEYTRLINLPIYEPIRSILPFACNAEQAHDGYFSKDKKGRVKDTRGNTQDDQDTYSLIMKDKEKLLSMQTPLRFIFSHSALREGWDNPNIFQVCTLLDNQSTISARQKIGRGLRLCVNQEGERVYDRDINVLHVIATESFADFANSLQKEMEKEIGIQFGIVNEYIFIDIEIPVSLAQKLAIEIPENIQEEYQAYKQYEEEKQQLQDNNVVDKEEDNAKLSRVEQYQREEPTIKLSYSASQDLIDVLRKQDIIDAKGKLTKEGGEQIWKENIILPEVYQPIANDIIRKIQESTKQLPIRNAIDERVARQRKDILLSDDFKNIWECIHQKTYYTVELDKEKIIKEGLKKLEQMQPIEKPRILESTAKVDITNVGINTQETSYRTQQLEYTSEYFPDILSILRNELKISKSTLRTLLIQSGRLQDFCNNPQKFIEEVYSILKGVKDKLSIQNITYSVLVNSFYDPHEVFAKEWKNAYIGQDIPSNRSIYEYVIADSNIEKQFATALEEDSDVRFYFKLPKTFIVSTPYGNYSPDWAILLNQYGVSEIHFVVETKGSTDEKELREAENAKIACAKRHFQAINKATYTITTDWKSIKPSINHIRTT